jgi:hypothetical protein
MRFFFSFAALSVSVVVGCSAASEDASSQSSDLVAPFWTQAEAASSIAFTHYASGDVPAGSACAPGTATYVVDTRAASEPGARSVYVSECAGAPARLRSRVVPLTDVQYTAIIGAARSVALSDKETCDAGADYVAFGVSAREAGAFPSQFATSERLGCDYGQAASGIEHVLELIEPIVAAAPVPPASVYFGETPAAGTRVWSAGSRIFLTTGGAGETPHGSTCVRDATEYIVTVADGELEDISVTKCAPMGGDFGDRLFMRSQLYRALEPAEKTRLTSALTQLFVRGSAQCTPGAEYERLFVTSFDPAGEKTAVYSSAENACVMGSDYAPFVDFTPLRRVLDELVAKP